MALPPDTHDHDAARLPLLDYARELFAGLDIADVNQIHVYDSFDNGQRRFLDWSMTGTQSSSPTATFMGFHSDLGAPLREVTIRIFTVVNMGALDASLDADRNPESRWDQLSALAQIGVRAVGRPVRGPLTILEHGAFQEAAAYGRRRPRARRAPAETKPRPSNPPQA